ncbi:hypothetical protein FOA52_002644 [Chlamydomonas sp. UWO 241]|nr:hypothetical protein FOA52_002644 [Chlamydomonas sp. UWO 241]
MSAAHEVKQLVERLLLLMDGGLVMKEGDVGDPIPIMTQAVQSLHAKVEALEQQMGSLKLQQAELGDAVTDQQQVTQGMSELKLQHVEQGNALLAVTEQQQRIAEQLEGMRIALAESQQQQQQQHQHQQQQHQYQQQQQQQVQAPEDMLQHLQGAWKRAEQDSYFICRCCDSACNSCCTGVLGQKLFRDALAEHLHKVTGMKPSVVQKNRQTRGRGLCVQTRVAQQEPPANTKPPAGMAMLRQLLLQAKEQRAITGGEQPLAPKQLQEPRARDDKRRAMEEATKKLKMQAQPAQPAALSHAPAPLPTPAREPVPEQTQDANDAQRRARAAAALKLQELVRQLPSAAPPPPPQPTAPQAPPALAQEAAAQKLQHLVRKMPEAAPPPQPAHIVSVAASPPAAPAVPAAPAAIVAAKAPPPPQPSTAVVSPPPPDSTTTWHLAPPEPPASEVPRPVAQVPPPPAPGVAAPVAPAPLLPAPTAAAAPAAGPTPPAVTVAAQPAPSAAPARANVIPAAARATRKKGGTGAQPTAGAGGGKLSVLERAAQKLKKLLQPAPSEQLTPPPEQQPASALPAPSVPSTQPAQPAPSIQPAQPVPSVLSVLPWTVLESGPLAGGTLDVVAWQPSGDPSTTPHRCLRIWTPPGFVKSDAGKEGWPVLYLNDGQNLFGDCAHGSAESWRVADTAAELIASGTVPPFLVVGIDHSAAELIASGTVPPFMVVAIDHSGVTRSLDYTPGTPGTGPGGFRTEAATWPGGGVDAYLEKVVSEVMPFARTAYGAASDADLVSFGGSSFGGICTLVAAMRRPGLFGAALVESPSLWIDNGRFLEFELAGHTGPWPERAACGMGGREYAGTQLDADASASHAADALLARCADDLELVLSAGGMETGVSLRSVIEASAAHNEAAWAARLPAQLAFLLGPWWGALASRHVHDLYFTVPRRLRAGCPAALVFNGARSSSLSSSPDVTLIAGFNGWASAVELPMSALPAHALRPSAGREGITSAHAVAFTPPKSSYEVSFAFCDAAHKIYDSNAGADFYARVATVAPEHIASMAYHYQNLPAEKMPNQATPLLDVARKAASSAVFTNPESLVEGVSTTLYFNRAASTVLRNSPTIKAHFCWSGWKGVHDTASLSPSPTLPRDDTHDWWSLQVVPPPGASSNQLELAFTDGLGRWDSNAGANYCVAVEAAAAQTLARPRGIAHEERLDHADGHLHVLQLEKRVGKTDRMSKWTEEKVVRVWTPPGYSAESAPAGGWPVLIVNDAQNKFECWLAHQGVSWRIGYTASELIARGDVPPFVIVGIDNPGAMRSLNYLPYAPGSGAGGFRGDAERWPGGGVDQYMDRVIYEIMPMVTQKFNLSTDPSRVAFGGGSFGGINALHVAMHYPHVFGSVLAESPSLWIAEGKFLEDMQKHT